jgi:hypothetical protein
MRTVFQAREDGYRHVVTRLDDRDINAWLVDAGGNTVMFLREFVNFYHPGDAEFHQRLDDLDREFTELVVKHPLGRDPKTMEEIKAKLSASPTAQSTGPELE